MMDGLKENGAGSGEAGGDLSGGNGAGSADKPSTQGAEKPAGDAGSDAGEAQGTGQEIPEAEGAEKAGAAEGSEEARKEAEAAALKQAWADFDRNLPKDQPFDPELLKSFANHAREAGLAPEQARTLVDWQLNAIKEGAERLRKASLEELKKEWGGETQPNIDKAMELVSQIDRSLPDGGFSEAIGKFGIANDANFVRGLVLIAKNFREDSLSVPGSQAESPGKPESALEGMRNALRASGQKF